MLREGLLGALFAVIVILLFLRNWRATIIAAVSIPLSILIAMVFLKQTNVTLNVMTLGGLTVAIGRVVDDSIVVIENIFRHLQRGETPNAELVRKATSEVASAITTSTLTTVAVFLPLGLVTGVIGKIFLPFAITVALALLASLLVAVTVVPLMAKWFLLKGKMPKEPEGESKPMALYRRGLTWSLAHRWIVVAVAVAMFVGSLALVPLIGTGFVPEAKEKYIQVEVTYPEGTKATEVDKAVLGIEKALASEKDVDFYQSTVGGSSTSVSMSGGLGGANTAALYIRLNGEADMDYGDRFAPGQDRRAWAARTPRSRSTRSTLPAPTLARTDHHRRQPRRHPDRLGHDREGAGQSSRDSRTSRATWASRASSSWSTWTRPRRRSTA